MDGRPHEAVQDLQTRQTHLHRRLSSAFQPLIVIAALATIPLTLLENGESSSGRYVTADWAIWALFASEFVLLLATAPSRTRYLKRQWLTMAVVVLSFPLLPSLLALTRLARLARLGRVLRLMRLFGIASVAVPALKKTVGRPGLLYVGTLTLLMVATGAGLLTLLEPSVKGDYWTGLWGAIVTTTTVGYGDISPATPGGRLVAVILMLCGIGLTATFAASVAAFFVGQDKGGDQQEIHTRLDRLEEMLAEALKNKSGGVG